MPRLTRRTFLASGVLVSCGGTAALETLKVTTPGTPQPIDAQCCLAGDPCAEALNGAPIPRITETRGVRWFLALGGQSNAVGRAPAVTIAQPFRNQRASGAELLPLVELERETIKSAAANMLTHLSGALELRVVAHTAAASNRPYVDLKKGTAAHSRLIRQLDVSKRAVEGEGEQLRALAFMVVHGESDHVAGNARYAADLREWQADVEADMRATTGQIEAVPLFTDQIASWTTYGERTSLIPHAQLTASVVNMNRIFLVGPKYQFHYEDGKHLLSSNLQWLGEYYGKAMARVFIAGEPWRPLSPLEIKVGEKKNIVRAKFWVPHGPLVFDTTRVPAKEHMGFELTHADASLTMPAIERVELVSEDTVELVARGDLPGCARLRYAASGIPRANAGVGGPGTEGAPRGNLRDSDPTRSLHGAWDLFNWCAVFDAPIGGV